MNKLTLIGLVIFAIIIAAVIVWFLFGSKKEVYMVSLQTQPYLPKIKDFPEALRTQLEATTATLDQLGDSLKKGASLEMYGYTQMPYGISPRCFVMAGSPAIYQGPYCEDKTKPCLGGSNSYNIIKSENGKYTFDGCALWMYGVKPAKAASGDTTVTVDGKTYKIHPFNESKWSQYD